MTVICKSGFENAKDLCTSTKKCEDETKTCLLKGQIGVCVCNPGYIGFKNECLEGNLTLNGTCKRNEQCSMVFGSVCQNNTCVCGLGYKSLNDSKCLLHSENSDFEARAIDMREDTVVGLMVGAVIGGLILGNILTVLGVIIYKNMRNGKHKAGKEEEQMAAVFENTSYETEREADQNRFTEQRTNEVRNLQNIE
ncbi:uncharacterized protein LOC134275838 [Saccostrea cucullata]|uniref:uncharacterized protein LOC134275838 n=1 Tax=Saccostrea cuccullata TaxID=36930 RepID=UPI002ED3ADC5